MSVSIRGCPACSAMVIGDSPSCPHCGHVLDASRASSEFLDLIPAGELAISEGDDERPCRQCGEMVRIGLVRCWHCGAFQNPEIEATYQRMQANPAAIMYSDVSNASDHSQAQHAVPFITPVDDDGGFELGAGYGSPATSQPHNPSAAPATQSTSAAYGYQTAADNNGDDDDFSLGDITPITPAPAVASAPAADPADQFSLVSTDHATAQQDYALQTTEAHAADQHAWDQQQYENPWGYKLSADGTAWEIDYDVWHAAGYDPHAQPGEPGYYDPYAAQGYDQQGQHTEGYAVEAPAETTPIPELPSADPDPAPAAVARGGEMPAAPDVAHSVSTGGESLLAAAMAEEKESAAARKPGARRKVTDKDAPPGSFVVYCPNGHRVQVHERHRGRAGRCPNCKAVFFVPQAEAAPASPDAAAQAATPAEPGKYQAGDYNEWIFDLRLHTVNPLKLKLKPGAMAGEYDIADVGFSEKDMLVATVFKRGGAFAAMQEKKKKPEARTAINDYLQTKKPASGVPAPFQTVVTSDDANSLRIVQPALPDEESIFVGIPVFGPGRIVVRLPATLQGGSRAYLSFSLSEFREFARLLEKVFGIVAFGLDRGIPLTDTLTTYKCHYSETELQALENVEYYQNDPALKPIVIGRKCAGCGLIVSEDSRKKEKIGGKTDASIAKANCPKCKKKFGDITLYGLDPNAKPIVFGMLPAEK